MSRFKNKVAIVTGANLRELGVGIGGATALGLAREGARLVIGDIPKQAAAVAALADKIRKDGGEVVTCELDLGSEASIANMIRLAVDSYGGIDILVNNAAELSEQDTDILDTPVEIWDRIMTVNARGDFLTIKYALPHMLKAGRGAIVNVSSGSALVGDITRTAFAASKGAINTLTQYVATLYGKQGIRCNAICPGLTLSAEAKGILTKPVLDVFLKNTLTPYLGDPAYLANAIMFLASDEAAFVTGIVMSVDGGMLQHQTYSADIAALMSN